MQSKSDRLIIEFNRANPSSWADGHAIDPLSLERLRSAFENAHDFFDDRKEELIQCYKWKESEESQDVSLISFFLTSSDQTRIIDVIQYRIP